MAGQHHSLLADLIGHIETFDILLGQALIEASQITIPCSRNTFFRLSQ